MSRYGTLTTITPESTAKGVETKKRNGTLNNFNSPESITKALATKNKNGSMRRTWLVVHVSGAQTETNNLQQYCIDNNLNYACMTENHAGRHVDVRGYYKNHQLYKITSLI